MKYLIDPDSCRICLRKLKKLRSLYKPLEDGDELPSKMLKIIVGTNMVLESWGAVPQKICRNCELSLNLAYQFRLKALKSQRIIENAFKFAQTVDDRDGPTTRQQRTTIKEELNQATYYDDEDDEFDDDDLGFVLQMNSVKEEKQEQQVVDTMPEVGEDKDFESQDDGEVQINYNSLEAEPNEEECTDFIVTQPEEAVLKSNPPVQIENVGDEEPEYLDVSFLDWEELDDHELITEQPNDDSSMNSANSDEECSSSSTGTSQQPLQGGINIGKKDCADSAPEDLPEKDLKENSHICDVCGNVYQKRGRMMEHRRRHNKDMRFACELCDQRFNLRENLRKHMYSHTGGKPYKCNFCSRTFFYQSVKIAHEAVHQGHKPFVCNICNKAFAYSHALKKHKLIHAEIKLFHCDYCSKDFRLQHHMKQHEETKLHQNAVKAAERSFAGSIEN